MKKIYSLRLWLIAAMLSVAYSASAYDAKVDGIYYTLDANTATASVTSGDAAYVGEVVIPSEITVGEVTYAVTEISEYAFNDSEELTNLTIGSNVKSFGEGAFQDCTGLTTVIVDKANGMFDSRDNCNAIIETATNTLIKGFNTSIIPATVTSIGKKAFSNCDELKSINIPNSVASIGILAFYGCDILTNVTIPNSVTSIGNGAFSYCKSLASVTLPTSLSSIANEVFSHCASLESITIPSSVITIGEYAFASCEKLESVTIPNSVESMDCGAFQYCTSLKSAILSNSLTVIPESAFRGCDALETITIPNSITEIEYNAFDECSSLTNVTIPNSVNIIGADSFYKCAALTSIAIPNSVTKIGSSAFYGCIGLTNVTIGNSVAEIGSMAFSWCENLTSIIIDGENKAYDSRDNCNAIIETESNTLVAGCNSTVIPNTVTSIGYYAFSGCTGLESIIIPNSVTLIDKCAFNGSKRLKNVTIGNSVNKIGYSAFSGCPLTSVIIPNSVTIIDQYAFYSCQELESLYLGKSVATIGNNAFSSCENLKSIIVDNENDNFDSRDNCNAIIETATNIIVKGTSATTIPNTVTAIGNSAFEFCKDLTSITIPSSVTGIGDDAFYGCTNLKSIVIPKTVSKISYGAFACSDELQIYVEWTDYNEFYNISTNLFTSDCEDYGTLYIPNGTLSIYKSFSPWRYFRNIVEYDPAGVDEFKVDGGVTIGIEGGKIVVNGAGDAKVEVFGSNGAAVYSGTADNLPELAAGIYIVRVGSTVKKVAVAQ